MLKWLVSNIYLSLIIFYIFTYLFQFVLKEIDKTTFDKVVVRAEDFELREK